eukprot:scaffold57088_cov57-Phaeocystis_antarctica.AAC.1
MLHGRLPPLHEGARLAALTPTLTPAAQVEHARVEVGPVAALASAVRPQVEAVRGEEDVSMQQRGLPYPGLGRRGQPDHVRIAHPHPAARVHGAEQRVEEAHLAWRRMVCA